jgi:hypothetical protein
MTLRAASARHLLALLTLAVVATGCGKNYINMHNGAPLHMVRVVHNCGNTGVAKVYFDREYRMKGHITGTSHSVMTGYPLRIRLAEGKHSMVVEFSGVLYTRDFRVTGPLELITNCASR